LDEGLPGPEHFKIVESTVTTILGEGNVLIKALVFSADPYLRGRIRSSGSFKSGQTLEGFIAGKVLHSKNSNFKEGDLVGGSLPFSSYQILTQEDGKKIWKLTGLIEEKDISQAIGVLGMPGSTAYGGLIDILRPNKDKGEVIFVSAASGAVGGLVGMLAKNIYGCKTIGSAGGEDKCKLLKEFYGFDHAIDYKTCETKEQLVAKIKEASPEGIDMYFENVGGIHIEAAMETLRPHGRVALCGQISEYNNKVPQTSSINLMKMIYTFQRIEGFVCFPWLSGQKGNFFKDMYGWLKEGKVKSLETSFDGVESWPLAFQSLFTGKNQGKVVVRL